MSMKIMGVNPRSCWNGLPRYISLIAMAIFLVVVIPGCGTGKKVAKLEPGKKPAPSLVDQLRNQRPVYDSFEGKAKLKIDSEDLKVGVNATIRMKKDSTIWAVVSKFGLEVGRMLIRPDSAFVVDRLNKVYYAESLEDYRKEYAIPFGFSAMQDLLLGIPVIIDSRKAEFHLIESKWVFSLEDGSGLAGAYTLDNQATSPRIIESNILDGQQREFSSRYGDFQQCKPCKGDLAYEREHHFLEKGDLRILSLSFSEITFDEKLSMPFEIPKHYDKDE